jgi:hypothetical protein
LILKRDRTNKNLRQKGRKEKIEEPGSKDIKKEGS